MLYPGRLGLVVATLLLFPGGCNWLLHLSPADQGRERAPAADLRHDAPADAAADLIADGRRRGERSGDGSVDPMAVDAKKPVDAKLPDQKKPVDAKTTGFHPLTTAQLSTWWQKLKAPCLDDAGQPAGADVPVLDTTLVTFFDGAITLAGAPVETQTWASGKSTVIIVWDLNSCGLEDPNALDNDWGTAGLLVRGASLDGLGQLVLPAGASAKDLDLLDVGGDGTYEAEHGGADDAGVAKQLLPTINAAKQGVLDAAKN